MADENKNAEKWIKITDRPPDEFVSVLGYMTDAGDFPAVRECFAAGKNSLLSFPALGEFHPASHWREMPEPPKEEIE